MQQDGGDSVDAAVDALKEAFHESALPPVSVKPTPKRPYQSIATLTWTLIGVVVLQLVGAAGNLVAMLLMRAYLDEQGSAPFLAAKLIVHVADPMMQVGYVMSLLVFCFWVHRAYANLIPLGSRHARFTPGWAVGHFFIPFAVLIRGVQVMRDLWIESQPLPVESPGPTPLVRRASLVGWWWAMWIVNIVASRTAHYSPHMTRAEWFELNTHVITSCAIELVTGVLFIAVLCGIARRQREQWDDMVRRQPVPPPTDLLR
jgi:hypothetical protein